MYRLLVAPCSAIASNHQTTIVALLASVFLIFESIMIPPFYATHLGESLFLILFYSQHASPHSKLFNRAAHTPRYHFYPVVPSRSVRHCPLVSKYHPHDLVDFFIFGCTTCSYLLLKAFLIVFKSEKSARKSKKSAGLCFPKQWDLLYKVLTWLLKVTT